MSSAAKILNARPPLFTRKTDLPDQVQRAYVSGLQKPEALPADLTTRLYWPRTIPAHLKPLVGSFPWPVRWQRELTSLATQFGDYYRCPKDSVHDLICHGGVDIITKAGEEVVACDSGTIFSVESNSPTDDNMIVTILSHKYPILWMYVHLDPQDIDERFPNLMEFNFLPFESRPKIVAGQMVGLVANKDYGITGPHLHFESRQVLNTETLKEQYFFSKDSVKQISLNPLLFLRPLFSAPARTSRPLRDRIFPGFSTQVIDVPLDIE